MFNLVVHGVCVGKVPAVLSQHLWEHDVPLVSKENISELFLLGYHPTWRRCHKRCQPRKSRAECWRHGCQGQSPMDFPATQSIYWHLCFLTIKVLFFNSATVFESLSMTSLIVWTVGWAWGDAVSQVRFRSVPLVQDSFNQNIFCFWNHVLFPNINASPFLNQIKQALQLLILILWIVIWPSHCFGSGCIDFPNFFHKRKIRKIMANVEQAGFAQNLTSQWNIGKTTKKE